MLAWTEALAVAALFALLFVAARGLLLAFGTRADALARLQHRKRRSAAAAAERYLAVLGRPYEQLAVQLESVRWSIRPSAFALLSFMMLLAGAAGGAVMVQSVKGALLSAALAGGVPYLLLRIVLTQRQLQSRVDFLPAVELFYQCYMIAGGRQIRIALQRTVDERRLLGPLQPVFEQLYRNLSLRGDDEASLRIFSAALGHMWGDYFTNMLRVALSEGCSIESNLKSLIDDMRQAQRANQQERNRLLEIRLANFSPVLFLALFLGVNFHYNPDNAYYYYFLDPGGRDMLLNGLALIFASFVVGLYLSRRKM